MNISICGKWGGIYDEICLRQGVSIISDHILHQVFDPILAQFNIKLLRHHKRSKKEFLKLHDTIKVKLKPIIASNEFNYQLFQLILQTKGSSLPSKKIYNALKNNTTILPGTNSSLIYSSSMPNSPDNPPGNTMQISQTASNSCNTSNNTSLNQNASPQSLNFTNYEADSDFLNDFESFADFFDFYNE